MLLRTGKEQLFKLFLKTVVYASKYEKSVQRTKRYVCSDKFELSFGLEVAFFITVKRRHSTLHFIVINSLAYADAWKIGGKIGEIVLAISSEKGFVPPKFGTVCNRLGHSNSTRSNRLNRRAGISCNSLTDHTSNQ